DLRTLFARQVLESCPLCAILFLSHGEPPGLLVGGTSILPQVRCGSFSFFTVLFHFTINLFLSRIQQILLAWLQKESPKDMPSSFLAHKRAASTPASRSWINALAFSSAYLPELLQPPGY
ncbi:MAG: hypothetical protein PUC00_03000, partial [Clostridiales bacterium]|nr:hypothetical protein [Clostridiales bacterium]